MSDCYLCGKGPSYPTAKRAKLIEQGQRLLRTIHLLYGKGAL
jgi:hypothetical protein